jgi:carotenoid 1,2-hydratase
VSARLAVPPLPAAPGTYRWLYTDVAAEGWTAVCIFMVGAVFSPRYAARRGTAARPLEHSAVNFALYRDGVRVAWAFTEYRDACREGGGLRVGGSRLAYEDGRLVIDVDERTAPWRAPLRARLELDAAAPAGPEMALDGAGRHRWQALVPRANAWLQVPEHGVSGAGLGYHDTNHGDERLGETLRGWRWARLHGPTKTLVGYQPPAPSPVIHVMADRAAVVVARAAPRPDALRRSRWQLPLPRRLSAGGRDVPASRLLESSPFYARQEGAADGWHALGEVADFARFRSPLIRWMARFRMRVERAA